jgi:hypothetical protein
MDGQFRLFDFQHDSSGVQIRGVGALWLMLFTKERVLAGWKVDLKHPHILLDFT